MSAASHRAVPAASGKRGLPCACLLKCLPAYLTSNLPESKHPQNWDFTVSEIFSSKWLPNDHKIRLFSGTERSGNAKGLITERTGCAARPKRGRGGLQNNKLQAARPGVQRPEEAQATGHGPRATQVCSRLHSHSHCSILRLFHRQEGRGHTHKHGHHRERQGHETQTTRWSTTERHRLATCGAQGSPWWQYLQLGHGHSHRGCAQ